MKLKLIPKDVGRALILENVVYYFFDYDTLHVFFAIENLREYPARHIWYVESCEKHDNEAAG